MKVEYITPENEILKELGKRLARVRKQQGFSQTRLAEKAGLGVATIRRIELGQDSQMESWLKLMKSLQMISAIDALLPETYRSPMTEALSNSKKRRKKKAAPSDSMWGDENK